MKYIVDCIITQNNIQGFFKNLTIKHRVEQSD